MLQECNKCHNTHELYYQIQKNNSKHLIMFCEQTVGKLKKTVFLPFVANLKIPVLHSKAIDYMSNKMKVPVPKVSNKEQTTIF